jgi:hypothetical protein
MNKILTYVLACTLGLAACGEAEQTENKTFEAKVVMPQPFKNMQKLMVRPGLDFYIVNWGKGADTLGAVLVLRTDTLKQENTAYNLEIEGKFIEAFNTDMDTDGNPEILIYTTLNDSVKTAELYCLEYNNGEPSRIKFPALTSKTSKLYRGKDNFYLHEGKLRRAFDLYENPDPKAKPTGKKLIEYSIVGNSFDITEIKEN